jgi:hypothetical protein
VKVRLAPGSIPSPGGKIVTEMTVIVMLAVAVRVRSACRSAEIATVPELGNMDGAVNKPELVIVPTLEFPPVISLTCHSTAELEVPDTVAVNCNVVPTSTRALVGEMDTETSGGEGDSAQPGPKKIVAAASANSSGGLFIEAFLVHTEESWFGFTVVDSFNINSKWRCAEYASWSAPDGISLWEVGSKFTVQAEVRRGVLNRSDISRKDAAGRKLSYCSTLWKQITAHPAREGLSMFMQGVLVSTAGRPLENCSA